MATSARDSSDEESATLLQTWRFPATLPAPPGGSFVVERTIREAIDGHAAPGLSTRVVFAFRVDHELAGQQGGPGEFLARLTVATGGEDPAERVAPSLDDPWSTDPMALAAAEAWVTCFRISDDPGQAQLRQVLGRPGFDGLIALRLLSHAMHYVDHLARLALKDAAGEGDELTRHPDAHAHLAVALRRAFEEELQAWLVPPSAPFAALALEGGVPLWDARLAGWLDRLGRHELGKKLRELGRAQAERPETFWLRWLPTAERPPLYRLTWAALGLWRARVRPRLERPAPSVPRGVLTTTLDTYQRHAPLPRLQTLGVTIHRTPEGDEIEVVDQEHRDKLIERLNLRGPVTDSTILDALMHKARTTRSVTGQVLLRHLFEIGYRQKVVESRIDFRSYVVLGGRAELCRLLGRQVSGDELDLLRDALDAYELIRIPLPSSGFDGLLKWSERKAAPGRKAEIQIVMMDPLLPGYVHSMPQSTPTHRQNRVLIPIPSRLPPLLGNRVTYGAKMLLQMLAMEALALGWREYARGVPLPPSAWTSLADRAELDRKEAEETRRTFVTGTKDSPPFLLELPDERYKLAPAYQDAERVILESAQIRTEAADIHRQKLRARLKRTKR